MGLTQGLVSMGLSEVFIMRATSLKALRNSCKWIHQHLLCHWLWRIICSFRLPNKKFCCFSWNIFKNRSCDATGLPVCKKSPPLSLPLEMALEKVMVACFLPCLIGWTGWCRRCQVRHKISVISLFLDFFAQSLFFWRCPAIKQALTLPALWHSANETLGMAIILTELMRIRVENPDWIIHILMYLYKNTNELYLSGLLLPAAFGKAGSERGLS